MIPEDLMALGYGRDVSERILSLLGEENVLEYYLRRGEKLGCLPIIRASGQYPKVLWERIGPEAPGCLWAKGDIAILDTPMVALVGCRDIAPENGEFAREVGRQAALQGYTLVSGNARGADKIAQKACLQAGGRVVSVVADALTDRGPRKNILYLSEDSFDLAFSAQRALSRNRVIHTLGRITFVAQSRYQMGGTWDGTVKNLRFGWSPVFCFRDGSQAMEELIQMGGSEVGLEELKDIRWLQKEQENLFDR